MAWPTKRKDFIVLPPELERKITESRRELNKGAWGDETRLKMLKAIQAEKPTVVLDGREMAITYHGDHCHVNPMRGLVPCGTYELKDIPGKIKELEAA